MPLVKTICGSTYSGPFAVLVDSILVDACDSPESLIKGLTGSAPRLTIILSRSQHHVGGVSAAPRPVLMPREVSVLRVSGTEIVLIPGPAESALIVPNSLVVIPCGVSLWAIAERIKSLGFRARCFVGGVAASILSEYSIRSAVAALTSLGIRTVVPIHTPPEVVKILERRFAVLSPMNVIKC